MFNLTNVLRMGITEDTFAKYEPWVEKQLGNLPAEKWDQFLRAYTRFVYLVNRETDRRVERLSNKETDRRVNK